MNKPATYWGLVAFRIATFVSLVGTAIGMLGVMLSIPFNNYHAFLRAEAAIVLGSLGAISATLGHEFFSKRIKDLKHGDPCGEYDEPRVDED